MIKVNQNKIILKTLKKKQVLKLKQEDKKLYVSFKRTIT